MQDLYRCCERTLELDESLDLYHAAMSVRGYVKAEDPPVSLRSWYAAGRDISVDEFLQSAREHIDRTGRVCGVFDIDLDGGLILEQAVSGGWYGENFQTEFKEARTALPKTLFDSVCAFSKREGGDIFLGVSDTGVLTGIDPSSAKKLIANFVTLANNKDKVFPPLYLAAKEYVVVSSGDYVGVDKAGKRVQEQAGEYHMVYDAFRRLIFNAVQKYKTLLIPFPRVCGIQHYSLGNGFIAR